MEIYLPPNIKSNFEGYDYLSSLYKGLINIMKILYLILIKLGLLRLIYVLF